MESVCLTHAFERCCPLLYCMEQYFHLKKIADTAFGRLARRPTVLKKPAGRLARRPAGMFFSIQYCNRGSELLTSGSPKVHSTKQSGPASNVYRQASKFHETFGAPCKAPKMHTREKKTYRNTVIGRLARRPNRARENFLRQAAFTE